MSTRIRKKKKDFEKYNQVIYTKTKEKSGRIGNRRRAFNEFEEREKNRRQREQKMDEKLNLIVNMVKYISGVLTQKRK
ncbi:hypothetical protein Glove_23g239 [Diversispora epigaea]|uniref:Uncharacterized protein n=1 Tax=Diversispora epigaea TaxID=1348612 RepID=A0A397JQN1_9GLOM|nr:hypothetical protein Glove_23g239 [Diversispora epigaea]